MRTSVFLTIACLAAAGLGAQGQASFPRLLAADLAAPPWNVRSGGIAAYDVTLDETGSVTHAVIVQDVNPYGRMLGEALSSWRFEPARRADGQAAPSRILVLGLFRPPELYFALPDRPRYKDTDAPAELPWPTSAGVPAYPPNALGSGNVILEADISEGGAVTASRQVSRVTAFDRAASDAARRWTFRPASQEGCAVPARAVLVFSFFGTTP